MDKDPAIDNISFIFNCEDKRFPDKFFYIIVVSQPLWQLNQIILITVIM
jgi:hypothetical protein